MRKTKEKETSETKQENAISTNISTDAQNDFIMLPTVDFCFKELMHNEKVRKGILAAILNVHPNEVEHTELLPIILRKESEDDKYGILDVRVRMKNGTQIDFEMQVSILNHVLIPEDEECYRRISFCDTKTGKEYSDMMEIYILELPKLPPEQKEETDMIQWMRFLGGKNREDLKRMAEKILTFKKHITN